MKKMKMKRFVALFVSIVSAVKNAHVKNAVFAAAADIVFAANRAATRYQTSKRRYD